MSGRVTETQYTEATQTTVSTLTTDPGASRLNKKEKRKPGPGRGHKKTIPGMYFLPYFLFLCQVSKLQILNQWTS